jgi:hypothetical protein
MLVRISEIIDEAEKYFESNIDHQYFIIDDDFDKILLCHHVCEYNNIIITNKLRFGFIMFSEFSIVYIFNNILNF